MKCPFCDFDEKSLIISKDRICFAIISKRPINKHHVLIIPNKHYQNFTDLPKKTLSHLMIVGQKMSKAVVKTCKPDTITYVFDDDITDKGYSTVHHYKLHIIPRFAKDISALNWDSMRLDASVEARSKFASEIKKNIN